MTGSGNCLSKTVAFLFQRMKASALLQDNRFFVAGNKAPVAPKAARMLLPRRRMPHAPVMLLATVIAIFSLVPLGFIGWITYDVGWETVKTLVFRPRVGELLVNTVLLESATIPLSIALAVTLAWLTERTDIPCARLWAWLAIAPLAVPAFVHSYAWVSLIPGMRGLQSGVFVSVIAYYPFLYLPVAAALRRLDPAIEDAAASLGLNPWRVFFRTVLPQLRFAICGGSLLIALHLLSEYGLFVMIRFDTFATAIVDQFQSSYNSPASNMLGGVLVACCLFLLGLEVLLRGNERYARVGPGSPRPADRRRLGWFVVPAILLPVVLAVLTLGVPLMTLGRWLYLGGSEIWRIEVGTAFLQTMALALAGGVLATTAAAPMAWLSVRAPGRFQRVLEACHYYVGSLPGVVVALALVTITVRLVLPLYQTFATLLVAYVMLFLPRAMVGLRASIAQAPVELERAAMGLGRTPGQAVRQITMRLAAPGAAASVALTALGITNELTATLMLSPNGVDTLATKFWSLTSEIDYVSAAPYAFMMVVLSLPLTLTLYTQSKRTAGQ
ncbi:iron(III) transport system permease protein [Rhizobium aethiopicum]|uniref:Iron(III) transport system permease protein n=1 Tax=Rhizobium aethiopicum TaxID=1138170 RepID=A0A7W6MG32_9HYPH|nr:iron ABC transporter permease [Rhizobium aethiopicum]MBB4191116.1 iron(III) transport system permease protein [Rhizobium aethiopicum]MBB4580113.1 iron(III) transport system permease protein [Rhizobium aethiopicum]